MGERGFSLVEVIVAAAIAGTIILFATGASTSITGAACYGNRKLKTEADCQKVLQFISNDLQNSSSDSDPETLVPRFEIEDSTNVMELVPMTALDASRQAVVDVRQVTATEDLESRPRENVYRTNSIFRFQKVHNIEVDPVKGEVTPNWSSPISYQVKDRRLIREHEGRRQVIASGVTVFRVVAEAQGNFRVFLRIQRRNPATGEVLTASGMIEVNPKNN